MKKTILLTVALCLGTFISVQAQDEAFKEDALKLTKMSSGAVEANMSQVYTMIPEDNLEAFKKELKPVMEDFYVKLAEKSMEYYSHDEIKKLLDFYNSDIGQKNLEVQEKMTKETMGMAQELNMKLMPLIQKYSK
ncbi:DUF2059 domain-containing protein [Mesohalobacter halotolerans]|uniref:DUF2059 domain-containing protein n=1 Tax=Mesohalobacter halotolerans TaxID=1883405 RepID=A0A4U5TWJ0_9FLAO|nr:DUF2059 domain-containing protein [Mesohalobacter halotolerans]TKS57608.1 DUF2059 domain-containing protein [Mesohalobacter halotolerans]